MSEERLDRIERKLDDHMERSLLFQGRLEQFMVNSDSYIKAVSANGKDTAKKLEDHEKDTGAHGANAKKELVSNAVSWGGGFVGLFVGVYELWDKVFKGHR